MEVSEKRIQLEGFFHVQIEESGKIVGDSGWIKNQITNLGILNFMVHNIGKSSGSKQIGYIALGTGGAPLAADTTLAGEIMSSTQRKIPTYANVGSTTAQFTATFASSDSFLSLASNLSNVGLFATNATNDTLFAGNTYASSSCNTNQNVNVTYQIRFTTA